MSRFRFLAVIFTVFCFVGCASSTVQTSVQRPAKINMAGFEDIIVGKFEGDGADQLRPRLVSKIQNTGTYRVYDRDSLDDVMGERALQQAGVVESSDEQGGYTAASAIITGKILSNQFNESRENMVVEGVYYERTVGRASVSATIKVVDLISMETLAMETLEANAGGATQYVQGSSRSLDPQPYLKQCYEDIAASFMKQIAPYTETVPVQVFSTKAPSMKTGLSYFKNGDYRRACEAFTTAEEWERNNPKMKPADLAKAIYNCGVAHEYMGEFEKAIEKYEEALSLSHSSVYVESIKRAQQRIEEEEEKMNQGLIPIS